MGMPCIFWASGAGHSLAAIWVAEWRDAPGAEEESGAHRAMPAGGLDLGTSRACGDENPASLSRNYGAEPFAARCKNGFDVASKLTQPAKVQEPSMDQILASIRRINARRRGKNLQSPEKPGDPQQRIAKPAVMKDIPCRRVRAGRRSRLPRRGKAGAATCPACRF